MEGVVQGFPPSFPNSVWERTSRKLRFETPGRHHRFPETRYRVHENESNPAKHGYVMTPSTALFKRPNYAGMPGLVEVITDWR